MFPNMYRRSGVFEAVYRAYSVGFTGKMEAEHGDKLILPQSALDRLGAHVVVVTNARKPAYHP